MANPDILLRSPLDMHLHFREGAMLELVAPLSAATFAGGVVMPNLVPPVDHQERLLAYIEEIRACVPDFEPYMTLFFRDYSESELAAAKPHILGIKLYPQGATTNSDAGVASLAEARRVMAMMEEMEIPLLVHGEDPDAFVMDREGSFLSTYAELAEAFPKLQITMEHITTAGAVELLDRHENLRATVTVQHLVCTLDDLAGGHFNPHLFCKPILKRPEDREALVGAALSHPKLMFGSDSAPHPIDKKECCGCAAGCFTAPIALPLLAELFETHLGNKAGEALQAFVSDRAQALYGVRPPEMEVRVLKEDMTVPDRYGDVVPMYAGRVLPWRA